MNRTILFSSVLVCTLATHLSNSPAADDAKPAPSVAETQSANPWTPLPDSALPSKTTVGVKLNTISKGILAGIAVDPTNGDVYALVGIHGLWKSTDQAATFHEPATPITGRSTSSFSYNLDPAGNRLACFLEYGTGGLTTDAGKTWTPFKVETFLPKVFDFGAVDWETTAGKTMLVLVHESKGKLILTTDAGETWSDLGAGFRDRGPIGIFDDITLIAAKNGKEILRSTDAGKTWTKSADLPAKSGQVIYVRKSVGYLLTEKGLLITKDKGATWTLQGSPLKATIGPFFGKDENHFAAVGDEGIYETTDAGKTWNLVAPLAPNMGPRDYSYAWDPLHNIFYAAHPNKPAQKCLITPH